MKKIFSASLNRKSISFWVLVLCCLGFNSISNAQVQSPCDARPFCSDSSYVFPNAIAGTLPAGIDQGCLAQAPAPIWYWMQIGTAGTMQLTLSQQTTAGVPIDVDFAMYGPFTDLPSGCAAVIAGAAPLQCSFLPDPQETLGLGLPGGEIPNTPPAAQVGEVYLVLITNFASLGMGAASAGSISFSQTAGTGAADCGIVCGLTADNSGDACMGNNVTVSGHNTDSTVSWSYHWTGPNGFTANTKNFTFAPTAAGVYNFSVTAISTDHDTCHAATSVTIFAKPNVALSNNIGNVVCFPNPLSVANPTAGDTYQWYESDVAIPGATNSTFNPANNGTFKLIAQNANGCVDSIQVRWKKVNVDYSFALSKACDQDTVRFTNLSEPGRYWWSYGDQTFPDDTIKSPTHIYDVQNVYVVRLKVRDSLGCVDSAVKTVNVTHPLNAAFTQSMDTLCLDSGVPVVFTDGSTGAINWNWNFGEGAPSNVQNPSYVFTQAGNHTIRLVVSDDIPCYDTAYRQVQVDAVPFFSISQDKHVICAGDALNFNADFYTTTIRNIAWNFGDGTQWNQLGATTHHYENPGIYWITADADFGACGISHDTDSIVVNAYPMVNLGPDSVLCLDGAALTVADLNNASDPTIQWHWNTGAITPSIQILHPGTYSLTATKNDCSTTETIEVNKDCYTDVPNVFTPNGDGVNDYFYPRQLLSKGVVGFSMTIFNRWGQKVFESTTTNGRGWDGKFNDKEQPMGVYIYMIDAMLKNGRNENYTGNVTLVR